MMNTTSELIHERIEHIIRFPIERSHRTPLLFLHGAWHGAWCWTQFMDYFCSYGYETHAISLPGHGNSTLNRGHIDRYTFDDYLQCLAAEIEKITPAPAVIGHSLGGAVLQAYLQVKQLPAAVLLASLPAMGHLRGFLRMVTSFPIQAIKAWWNGYALVETPQLAAHHLLAEHTQIDLEHFHQRLVSEPANTGMRLVYPFSPHPNKVKTPLLVLAGGKDTLISMTEQCRTAEVLHAKLVIFPDQPHDLMLEAGWQDVAATIDDWITCDLNLA